MNVKYLLTDVERNDTFPCMGKIVTYIRVSTEKQGQSGLGLDAQRAAVRDYARAGGHDIEAAYVEVESGTRSDRPELQKAISHAKRSRAKLVIAKLDRLARNVAFLATLMESGCEFLAVDNPTANRLTLHILAAVAEDEAARISARTVAALQAAKARGTLLGSAREGHWAGREDIRLAGLAKGRERARVVKRERAMAGVADLLPEMKTRRANGESLATIAAALNTAGHRTTWGNEWSAMGVKLVLDRAASN